MNLEVIPYCLIFAGETPFFTSFFYKGSMAVNGKGSISSYILIPQISMGIKLKYLKIFILLKEVLWSPVRETIGTSYFDRYVSTDSTLSNMVPSPGMNSNPLEHTPCIPAAFCSAPLRALQ
jgi:hypothetical protein